MQKIIRAWNIWRIIYNFKSSYVMNTNDPYQIFLKISLNVHHLNDSIYMENYCNQAQFLKEKIIMKCPAIFA